MSVKHIGWAFELKLPSAVKFTLVAICDYLNHNGEWSIKHSTLAEKTGQGRRTIIKHVAELEQRGILTVITTRREDGRQGANRYRVNFRHPVDQSAFETVQSASDDSPECNLRQIQSAPDAHQLPPDSTTSLPPPTDMSASADADEHFEELWKDWNPYDMPKGSKKEARVEWNRHVRKPGVDPGMVRARAKAYCAQCHRQRTKTKHVCRWIKGHLWEDDSGLMVDGARRYQPVRQLVVEENQSRQESQRRMAGR